MRIETDISETERKAVKNFADRNGFNMSHAYATLIRRALQ